MNPKLFISTLIILFSCVIFAGDTELDTQLFSTLQGRSIGPASMSGRVSAIDISPLDPNLILVGSATGGLWKSSSGGARWEPIFDYQSTLSIGDVKFSPSNPSTIWVGTGEANPRNLSLIHI